MMNAAMIAQIVLLLGLGVGAIIARRGNIAMHQYNQTAWVLLNIVLTIFIMIVAYIEYVLPDLPGNLRHAFGLLPTIHAALGLLAIFCGVYLILRMNQWIPKKWRIKWWASACARWANLPPARCCRVCCIFKKSMMRGRSMRRNRRQRRSKVGVSPLRGNFNG